jgi:DNA-binding GntR family transcriptional regulator
LPFGNATSEKNEVNYIDLSQSENAYRVLSEQIVTLQITPGRVMTEQELMEVANFGRTPVREALQKLERDMLIQILPRRGILIEPIDFARPLMALDVRIRIESLIMEWIAAQMELSLATNNPVAFAKLDQDFDEHALYCARHEVAARVLRPLHAIGRRIGYHEAIASPSVQKRSVQLHVELARAVASQNFSAVNQSLEALFEAARQTLLAINDGDSISEQP